MKALVPSAGLLLLLIAVVAGGIGTAQTPDAAVQITSLSVERVADGVEVRIKTSGTARFQSSFIDTPNRLVVDLPGATYAWSKSTINSDADPVRQVRGSQWKGSVARVVVELTRKVGYRIDVDADGLRIVLEPAGTALGDKPAPKPREAKAKIPPALAVAEPQIVRVELPPVDASPVEPQKVELKQIEPIKVEPVKTAAVPEKAAATVAVIPDSPPVVAPKAVAAATRIAQAAPQPAPQAPGPPPAPSSPSSPPPPPPSAPPAPGAPSAPTGQAPSGTKLISLDFRDADVVNLLRILAAESGRNIVAGEDV